MKHIIPTLTFAAFVLVAGAGGNYLDQWDKKTAAQRAAQKAEQAKARYYKAAKKICGENAAWIETTDIPGQIECLTHKGARRATKGML